MSRRYLIDTNLVLDSIKGVTPIPQRVIRSDVIFLSQIVVGEIKVGLDDSRRGRDQRAALEAFLRLPNVVEISITSATTDLYAKVFRSLRAAGTPIPVNDIWLAAQALEHGAVVVTRDRHFDSVANLLAMVVE